MRSLRGMAVPFQGINVPKKCEKLNVSQHIWYLKGVKNLLGPCPQNRILLPFKCCFQNCQQHPFLQPHQGKQLSTQNHCSAKLDLFLKITLLALLARLLQLMYRNSLSLVSKDQNIAKLGYQLTSLDHFLCNCNIKFCSINFIDRPDLG